MYIQFTIMPFFVLSNQAESKTSTMRFGIVMRCNVERSGCKKGTILAPLKFQESIQPCMFTAQCMLAWFWMCTMTHFPWRWESWKERSICWIEPVIMVTCWISHHASFSTLCKFYVIAQSITINWLSLHITLSLLMQSILALLIQLLLLLFPLSSSFSCLLITLQSAVTAVELQ